jgi:hypothetical protein
MNAWEIIEAIDDPSGLIHPEKHQAFAQGTHPLARHPAFPEHRAQAGERASNYEEVLASRQWQKILQKANQYLGVPLTTQALPLIQRKLIDAMRLIDQAESRYNEELEALAIELVFELPEFKSAKSAYENNRLVIDASLSDEIDTTGMMTSDEPEAQQPFRRERTPAEQDWIKKMVQRRHFTNAMIQGAAVSNDYLFELAGPALDRIHPGLRKAYGVLMIATEIGYWMFPQDQVIAGARAQTHVGSVRVDMEGDEEEQPPAQAPEQPEEPEQPAAQRPVIHAAGKCFPVLIQEIIKGLAELASLPSLPRDPEERQEVINKADLTDMEAWHMILGPKLWDSFVEAVDAENERELTMHLYRHIQQMDVDEFNQFMREVLGKTPQGMQMLRQLAAQVKAEMAEDEELPESALIVRALLDD